MNFGTMTYIGDMKMKSHYSGEVIPPSELPLNPDGSVYHLALRPEHLADTVIVVGDPGRVGRISRRFDRLELEISNREFLTHTGVLDGKRLSVMSTGIGVDNLDIVMNELDALRHIDLASRRETDTRNPLDIIRLGTSGSLSPDLEVGSFVNSVYALGLDGVMHFYDVDYGEDEEALVEEFVRHVEWKASGIRPYAVGGNAELSAMFGEGFFKGITATACGFYGPQGRKLRLDPSMPGINERMANFSFRGTPMANYEMESSSMFGLGAALGHRCTTVCVIVANRMRNEFTDDHHKDVDRLIEAVLERVGGR